MTGRFPSLQALCLTVFAVGLVGCVPEPNAAIVGPDKDFWAEVQSVPPRPGTDELVPTQRLVLKSRWRPGSKVLVQGVPDFCGTDVRWLDSRLLGIRLSEDRASALTVADGFTWNGVTVKVGLHEDLVWMRRESPDGAFRLLVIANCETDDWNLYLRHAGEPVFTDAMKTGWDDPELFGGLSGVQAPLALEWIGARRARITVPQKLYHVTLRPEIDGVQVDWVYRKGTALAAQPAASLKQVGLKFKAPSLEPPTLLKNPFENKGFESGTP
jgi:hypothetical protein